MKKILLSIFLFTSSLFTTVHSDTQTIEPQKDTLPINVRKTPAPKEGTVVLVHGFMSVSKSMTLLSHSLTKRGWKTKNWGYKSRKETLSVHGAELNKLLNQIATENPGKPISFVTHSMGALVVKSALNQKDCPVEAKQGRAVLIAPPANGSIYARKLYKNALSKYILGKEAGHQLMTTPRSGFDNIGQFPKEMPILIISGTAGLNPLIPEINDGKVGLSETCLKTPHYHKTIFAGHSWICQTPTTIKFTNRFLSTKTITTPLCTHTQPAK